MTKDPDYTDYGVGKYLTNSIKVTGQYQTANDFNANVQDGSVNNAKIKSLIADKIVAGTIDASVISVVNLVADNITSGKITSSDGKTWFDLDNDEIIQNDGTNDRIWIGDLT
jgi:hypothetical protein